MLRAVTYSLAHLYGSSASMFGRAHVSRLKADMIEYELMFEFGCEKTDDCHMPFPKAHVKVVGVIAN
jgi:hypothetical protein